MRTISFLLFIAILVRILLMLWSFEYPSHKDVYRFRDWAMIPYVHELTDPYIGRHLTFSTEPLNLPPGTLYIVAAAYRVNVVAAKIIHRIIAAQPGSIQWVNVELTNAFLRMPALFSDILIGYLIYLIVKKHKQKRNALIASSLYLFNPSIVYNSAIWGQMDAIHNGLFFLGVYLVLFHNKLLGILSIVFSLYVKFTLVYVIVPYLAVLCWFERQKRKLIGYIGAAIFLILVLTLPISSQPHVWFLEFIQKNSLGEMKNITSLAFNFWWAVFRPKVDDFGFTGSPESTSLLFGIPLFYWALTLTAVVFFPLIIIIRKKSYFTGASTILLWLSLVSLICYLFLPHMHERYLFPFFMLMATFIGLTGRFFWTYVILSMLNGLNLYIVWHPVAVSALPLWLLTQRDVQWVISVLTTGIGLVLYMRGVRLLRSLT